MSKRIFVGTAIVLISILTSTGAGAQSALLVGFTPFPDTNIPNTQYADSRMVCSAQPSANTGTAYSIRRKYVSGNAVTGAVRYDMTPAGVSATDLTSAEVTTPTHPNSWLDYSVVGFAGYDNTGAKGLIVFGGRGGSNTYSSTYLRFKPGSGFGSPQSMGPVSPRAGMAVTAVSARKVILMGGYDGAWSPKADIFEFDEPSGTITAVPTNMPVPLANAKTLVSNGGNWIYVIGGGTGANGDANRRIYRFDATTKAWTTIKKSAAAGDDLLIPGMGEVQLASVQGSILILTNDTTSSVTGAGMTVYKLNPPAAGGSIGSLTAKFFPVAPRARGSFSMVRCGADTWAIGGTYGNGPSFSDRTLYVDKLSNGPMKIMPAFKPIDAKAF